MAVKAAYENYAGPNRDALENFHGNQLVYIAWDEHMMFPCAGVFPLPPQMPFGALVKEVVPGAFSQHPDFANINWEKVEWMLDGNAFQPSLDKSLADNNVNHKSLIRMITPSLNGINNSGF
jgi:phenol/toluene 2-monooxygenase (NADH) P4/A4